MPDVTGAGAIGTSYRAFAGIGIANETIADAFGFGPPTFDISAVVAETHGTADLTSAAASLSSTGDLAFTGTASFTSAAAQLDSTALLSYNGVAGLECAPASLAGTGLESETVTGTADWTSAPALLSATGSNGAARRQQGGFGAVDLAGYSRFVAQADQILDELGQPPATTGVEAPVVLPTVESRPPDYREAFAKGLLETPLVPVVVPPLAVTGKRWIRGTGHQTSPISWLTIGGTNQWEGTGHLQGPETSLQATGAVDLYAMIRRQDDIFIEKFIRQHLYGERAA